MICCQIDRGNYPKGQHFHSVNGHRGSCLGARGVVDLVYSCPTRVLVVVIGVFVPRIVVISKAAVLTLHMLSGDSTGRRITPTRGTKRPTSGT